MTSGFPFISSDTGYPGTSFPLTQNVILLGFCVLTHKGYCPNEYLHHTFPTGSLIYSPPFWKPRASMYLDACRMHPSMGRPEVQEGEKYG
jgi:hypothetical protein